MKLKTWVQFEQEVDVEVSIADVMSTISGMAGSDQIPMLFDCINCAHSVLREIPVAQIERMKTTQRKVISDALKCQAARFAPTASVELASASGSDKQDSGAPSGSESNGN